MGTASEDMKGWLDERLNPVVDRLFRSLDGFPFAELPAGLAMELHYQALMTAASRVLEARAGVPGMEVAATPFTGYGLTGRCVVEKPGKRGGKRGRGPGRTGMVIPPASVEADRLPETAGTRVSLGQQDNSGHVSSPPESSDL